MPFYKTSYPYKFIFFLFMKQDFIEQKELPCSTKTGEEIYRDPRDFPREILRVEGIIKGGGDGFPILSSLAGKY